MLRWLFYSSHFAGALVDWNVLKITMICVCGLVKASAAGKYLNNYSRKYFLSLFMSRACSCLDAIAATLKRSIQTWNCSLGLVAAFQRWNSCRCLFRHYLLSAFFSFINLTDPQALSQFPSNSELFLLVCHLRSHHPTSVFHSKTKVLLPFTVNVSDLHFGHIPMNDTGDHREGRAGEMRSCFSQSLIVIKTEKRIRLGLQPSGESGEWEKKIQSWFEKRVAIFFKKKRDAQILGNDLFLGFEL